VGAFSLAVGAAGIPSPTLFAGLLVGMAFALSGWRRDAPRPIVVAAQATVGATAGSYVALSTFASLGAHILPVLGAVVVTLAITVLAGELVARLTTLDRATSAFGMIAGGASGIIAIARDLGADERQVALMQYLRVLLIVLITPLAATAFAGAPTGGGGASPPMHHAGWAADYGYAALASAVGVVFGRLVRLPASSVLGPLLVAGALTVSGATAGARVPGYLQGIAFAAIGVQVGLRFTVGSLREARSVLPVALGTIAVLLLSCAGLGLVLAPLAGVSPLDGYLATTPGGLYAVLATALGSGADSTFVLAFQVLRLLVMLLAAPLLARWLSGE